MAESADRAALLVRSEHTLAKATLVQALADNRGHVLPLCLRLQRGCGVRGWGRDGLGTGARGRGARARRALMLPSLQSA